MPLFKPENVNTPVLTQFSLAGKIAAVTGGAKGIGLEIVRGLAEAGADVALLYGTSRAAADEAAATISAATGVRIATFSCDVGNRANVAEVLEKQVAQGFGGGRLDIVVANAGVNEHIPALEYTEEQWARNNAVNLDGVMWTAQAAGRVFEKQGKGNLIITASVSATLVNVPQRQAAYNASKAAAVHLGKSLAVEWADFARVNCISPGFVMTEMLTQQPKERFDAWMSMVPGKRICDAAELKSAYVFLASDACSYMTGADLVIDGGYTLP
ncbi:NAD(P)-binding protein [Cryphonectria parasitica EP155]|uniref:NAD(P)-binding protein n=1 Tax=Cryphonectria parasitica (strain ATCC 38755 / EP155) TaxID=660469 RepID=A0A9P4XZT1_CRYP1|nr:NAD(P)-binding protein [Cryphonectria parasitica EP155]KAF3763904.1 NAD(P)-binding protein [Cryphonectria parasitica EP155]